MENFLGCQCVAWSMRRTSGNSLSSWEILVVCGLYVESKHILT